MGKAAAVNGRKNGKRKSIPFKPAGPVSELGRRLIELSNKFAETFDKPMSIEEIRRDLSRRRG